MAERLLVVLLVAALTVGVALIVRALVRRRAEAVIGQTAPASLRGRIARRGPTLVYFYGPNCGTCEEQARALGELASEGLATVVSIDATEERDLADALGAVTIPTTAVLDRFGRIRDVNLGYHPKSVLAIQLGALRNGAVVPTGPRVE